MFNKGKNISTYKPTAAKLEGSIKYWENFYGVRLKPASKKLFLKNARVSIQNKKQISAFIHGYLRGLLVDSKKYVIRTKRVDPKFDKFESTDIDDSSLTDVQESVQSILAKSPLTKDLLMESNLIMEMNLKRDLPSPQRDASPEFLAEFTLNINKLREIYGLGPIDDFIK